MVDKMNNTLLDNDKIEDAQSVPASKKFKSRVPSDLMIVLGVLHVIFGFLAIIYYFNLIFEDLGILTPSDEEYMTAFIVQRAGYNSLIFFFGIVLIIGGVGLVRHKRFGWVFTLAGSTFGIMLPAFLLLISLFIPGLTWSFSTFFVAGFLVFFGLSFAFLLSKTIRNFYQPTMKSYVRSGIILFVLSIVFVTLPFLTAL